MTLPDFVGIGAPRSGTSWLNQLLSSHPDVYTPSVRDEINFFDQYHERGLDWYAKFFPSPEEASQYRVIGEVTPQYLECASCPERIASALPDARLIVSLRHPVTRAYSQYGFYVQRRNFRGSFEEFVAAKPRSLERGLYSRYLKRYLQHFDRARILILIFEDAVEDVETTKRRLAEFLGIAVDRFPEAAGRKKVNPSSVPRFQLLYGAVAQTGRLFRKLHLEPVVDWVMRSRLPKLLAKGDPLPPLDAALRARMGRSYEDELSELEAGMGVDVSSWRE